MGAHHEILTVEADRPSAGGYAIPAASLGSEVSRTAALPVDPFRGLLFLLTVVSISRIHQHFDVVARLQPALVLAGLAFAYAVLNPRTLAPQNLIRTWPAQILAGLGILACLSVPFGISMGNSASFMLESFAKTLIFAAMLMAAMRRGRDLFLFVWAYVIACGILAAMMIFVFDLTLTPDGRVLRLANLYTYDSNDAGLVLTIGLPLTLLTLQTSKMPGKMLSALTLVGIGIAIARTGSRGTFLGLAIVGLALLLCWPQASLTRRLAAVGAVALTVTFAAPRGYWAQMETLMNPTKDYNWDSINGRKAVALRGIGYMMDHPFFGVGIDNFARAEGTISEKAKERHPAEGIRWTAPHNSFIQVGAETGFPGLILWSTLVFGGIAAGFRLKRRLPPDWIQGDREERFLYLSTVYLPLAFLGFAVTGSFLSFAYMDPIYVLAACLTGLYASLETKRRRAAHGLQLGIPAHD